MSSDVVKRPNFAQKAHASPDLVNVTVYGDKLTGDLFFRVGIPFSFGLKQILKNLPTDALYMIQEMIEEELAKREDAKK